MRAALLLPMLLLLPFLFSPPFAMAQGTDEPPVTTDAPLLIEIPQSVAADAPERPSPLESFRALNARTGRDYLPLYPRYMELHQKGDMDAGEFVRLYYEDRAKAGIGMAVPGVMAGVFGLILVCNNHLGRFDHTGKSIKKSVDAAGGSIAGAGGVLIVAGAVLWGEAQGHLARLKALKPEVRVLGASYDPARRLLRLSLGLKF